MTIALRESSIDDLPFIVGVEHAPEFREYIGTWTQEEHAAAMHDPDTRYLIVLGNSANALGYVILRGLKSEHHNIELKRIALRAPGKGHGRQALQLLLRFVFDEAGAHRLWLDVYETNLRAQHLYRSLGFQQDGIFREAVYRDDRYHSLLLMSMLDRKYRAR
jgi:RimJ/RimL family protein N-acetyltransferase